MEGRFLVCCQSDASRCLAYEFVPRAGLLPGRFPSILLSSSSDSSPLKFSDVLVTASLLAGSRSLASSSIVFLLPLRMSDGLASVPIFKNPFRPSRKSAHPDSATTCHRWTTRQVLQHWIEQPCLLRKTRPSPIDDGDGRFGDHRRVFCPALRVVCLGVLRSLPPTPFPMRGGVVIDLSGGTAVTVTLAAGGILR